MEKLQFTLLDALWWQGYGVEDGVTSLTHKAMASGTLTKDHLDGMEARIQESIRGLNTNFHKGQGVQNGRFDRLEERLDSVDVKLDAIILSARCS